MRRKTKLIKGILAEIEQQLLKKDQVKVNSYSHFEKCNIPGHYIFTFIKDNNNYHSVCVKCNQNDKQEE